MKTDFILPDIGEGIVECELVEWRVQEGDPITEDQPVADVLTDKALVEITAMHTGVVTRLYCQQGDMAKVHQPLFEIEVADDTAATSGNTTAAKTDKAAHREPHKPSQTPTSSAGNSNPTANNGVEFKADHAATTDRVLATPAVRRIAREHDLDLRAIPGSGRNGRVLKEDVLRFEQANNAGDLSETEAGPMGQPQADRTEPIQGIRAAMARQMTEAMRTIPHFTYADEIDVTALNALRQRLKPEFERQGTKLSMMPLVIKALELAIRQYPLLNSRVNQACTELTYLADVNIGMAADTPMGLMVPNIKRVQHRSLLAVAQEVTRLTESARAGKLSRADLTGGTISVSNIGAIGGTVASPIVNPPEVAIVALGRVQTLPRFGHDGAVESRQIMTVSWSGDHRVIDGATMARFCNVWKTYLEEPEHMLTVMK